MNIPRPMRAPAKFVQLNMAEDHSGDSIDEVMRKIEYRSGRTSPLVGMAVHPDHRDEVERMRHYVFWQFSHCGLRGANCIEQKRWLDACSEVAWILACSEHAFKNNQKRIAPR